MANSLCTTTFPTTLSRGHNRLAAAVRLAERCVLCGARAVDGHGDEACCTWCGARWILGHPDPRPAMSALMAEGPVEADPSELCSLHLDNYTFRSAATVYGLAFTPTTGPIIADHSDAFARGRLHPLEHEVVAANVTLVILSRSLDAALDGLLRTTDGRFAETIVVVDRPDTPHRSDAHMIAHPLVAFDQSRNLAQEAARTAWTFHLDADERVPDRLLRELTALTALADAAQIDAIGFRRRNLVDGVLSDLWPDVQYRLVRQTVRFEGAVHERPDSCADWRRTMIAMNGAITHHLTTAHVDRRRERYDAMGQRSDRAYEAEALTRPFMA